MKKIWLFFAILTVTGVSAQSSLNIERSLNWKTGKVTVTPPGGSPIETVSFEGSVLDDAAPELPFFSERFELQGAAALNVEVTSASWEQVTLPASFNQSAIAADLTPTVILEQERLRYFGRVSMYPFRRTTAGRYEKLTAFSLRISIALRSDAPVLGATDRGVTNSKLSDGNIYKFGVSQTSVYKLSYDFLKNKLGISNLDQIDPRKIQLLGNGGFMVPERNNVARPDDVLENAIFVSGENDGKFDATDYILFYATGPAPMVVKNPTTTPQLTIQPNIYDRNAWYFIKIGNEQGLRIANREEVAATVSTDQFDDVGRLEEERYNLLDWSQVHQGSGKKWYGDLFDQTREREYTINFPNVLPLTSTVKMDFAGRCDQVATTVRLTTDGSVVSATVGSTDNDNNNANVASTASLAGSFTPDNDVVNLKVEYLNSSKPSQGWIDFIEVNVRRQLSMYDKIMFFRDLKSRENASTEFQLGNVSGDINIWDITDPQVPYRQAYRNVSGKASFGANTNGIIRNYAAYYDDASFPSPEATIGRIDNQNLHALTAPAMIIIYHAEFEGPVQQLAQHRRDFSGLTVETVRIDQVYNEFGSGAKDAAAIRDFAKLMFEKSPGQNGFRYLLLFGDGSYDPKNNSKADVNNDFIVAWETSNSLSPIYAHPSDDFYALLSTDEGDNLVGAMEIAVGRIPAGSIQDAETVVTKIIDYDRSPATLGDWHNRVSFVADDEESNHINQAEVLATATTNDEDWFNVNKIYFDAYQRVASASEKRIPDAKAAINADIFKGALVFHYIGHGGPKGWGQERVVDIADIQGWENKHHQTLFVTATCSFGGFDDFEFVTGAEMALLEENGGGMGLFTTVRPVYISSNEALTSALQKFIFKHEAYGYRTIGEILKDAKNTVSGGTQENSRRFLLFGDPAQKLAMPEYRVQTDSINSHAVLPGAPDTLRALQRGVISGSVTDTSGNLLPNFNGRVYVTIFDKPQQLRTLGENNSQVTEYSIQRNALFRGSATVKNGKFSISFVVPKDINYTFGYGKISYYAEDGSPLDAAGGDREHLVIGGTSKDVQDDEPPVVQVFMNTEEFVSGGLTNNDPKILVRCTDDNGMNVSGTSLGHDLTAVLDDNVIATLVLNEFYESALDNPRTGTAIYPLRNLATGKHTLRVKGWDIANNSGEGYTEFIVTEDGKAALEHVLNYPNPFTTNTYFQFEHNLAGQFLDVQISIFSVSGKLVKTIQHGAAVDNFRVTDINWDGKDEYGDQLAKGVYVYRVKVRGTDNVGQQVTAESDFEKLVILK